MVAICFLHRAKLVFCDDASLSSQADAQQRIAERWPMKPVKPDYVGEVARRYAFEDGQGEVGFISSVTQPFCGACTRARLSSDGALYTCLFAQTGRDIRGPMRAGASDAELEALIRGVWLDREDHYSEQRATLRANEAGQHKVEMNFIGG